VSFGLPQRELVNAVFLSEAFGAGLDLAIMNPLSRRMCDVVATQRVLNGQDEACRSFIGGYANEPSPYAVAAGTVTATAGAATAVGAGPATDATASSGDGDQGPEARARSLVLQGRAGPMADVTRELLATHDPLDVINGCLVPALDEVGDRFERGEYFLPQLMASAEAVKAGFDVVRAAAPSAAADKGTIVLATVKGDIHDIGKNIVRMLLENYGYSVIDLGRDVDPQVVVDAVVDNHVRLVGLSALMTTTVRAMEETIALLREQGVDCKVMVGGAVLNPEYAKMVGADYYAKDAAESARIAGELFGE
jgi:5-methyltetrahydrofolate--homocysteine methyltransferase